MAFFKTSQYQIITSVVYRIKSDIILAQLSDELNAKQQDTVWMIGDAIMESFVNELCIEFAKDNRLFNETLFRAQCDIDNAKQQPEINVVMGVEKYVKS